MINEIFITNSGNNFHYVTQSGKEMSGIIFLLDISKHTGIKDAIDVDVIQNEYMGCFCVIFLKCCSCDQLEL